MEIKTGATLTATVLIGLLALSSASGETAAPATKSIEELPDGEGKNLLTMACSGCHGLDNTLSARKDAGEWEATIKDMISRGAQIFPDEVDTLTEYLSEELGPDTP